MNLRGDYFESIKFLGIPISDCAFFGTSGEKGIPAKV